VISVVLLGATLAGCGLKQIAAQQRTADLKKHIVERLCVTAKR
jgi:hypothetical protein